MDESGQSEMLLLTIALLLLAKGEPVLVALHVSCRFVDLGLG